MLRFLARLLGFWLVAAALVAAVVDGAKSIAASGLVLTPVAETWAALVALAGGEEMSGQTALEMPWPLDVAFAWLLSAPSVVVLAVVGIFFLVVGAKRRRSSLGREFPA
jgi:hypothetical protein